MGHVKRSYGPSESSAKNPRSIVAVRFCKSPEGGLRQRAPSGGDYLVEFEAFNFLLFCHHTYIYIYIYIHVYIFYLLYHIFLLFISITEDINQLKAGQGQSSGLTAAFLDLFLRFEKFPCI